MDMFETLYPDSRDGHLKLGVGLLGLVVWVLMFMVFGFVIVGCLRIMRFVLWSLFGIGIG